MDKELEQKAIETFAVVPEVYQQAFRDAGADFPDELVAEIKKDPNQAIELVNTNKDLKSAVINVFKSNKDAIIKYAQQAIQQKFMFKDGGKFDYLKKLQSGGIVDPTYSTRINAPGDTLRTKIYKYRTDEMQTYPNGNVLYTTRDNSQDRFSWSPESKPNFIQRIWFGNETASPETIENWRQLIENHKNDAVIDKTKELQKGGSLSRQEMFDKANANRGFSKANARLAYANAKAALRDQGYRGAAMRAAARRMVAGTPVLAQVNMPDDSNFVIPSEVNEPVLVEPDMSSIDALINKAPVLVRRVSTSNNARPYSLPPEERVSSTKNSKNNTKSGGLVVVKPARTVSGPLNTVENSNSNVVVHPLPESERAAHNAYIESLNGTSAPIISSNNQRVINDLWSGSDFGYYDNKRPGEYVMVNPENYVRTPDGRWISPDQRYTNGINYGPISVRKRGGKISEENEANKKYIKASEKAGQEASKKMTDLKNKHKAELKKIK